MINRPALLSLALLAALLPGCAGGPESDPATAAWGAPVSAAAPLTLAELLDQAATRDGTEVVVSGTVKEVCQNKGCWVVLADGDREMRIKFKDYAFFVPMDLAGETLVAEGIFAIEMVSVDDAQHYLEDAGRHDEAARITEPQRSFSFMASGVRRGGK